MTNFKKNNGDTSTLGKDAVNTTNSDLLGKNSADDEYKKKISEFSTMISKANNIVFVGGAGVSTESGIPDFRGEAGLYVKENNYKYKPRGMLSKGFFYTHCADFFDFYKSLCPAFDVKPNVTHDALHELEKKKNLTIITQNIDGLHEKAGSVNVINLHGTAIKNHCMICRREYGQDSMHDLLKSAKKGVPKCPRCHIGTVRPNVILYDEMIPITPLIKAKKAIKEADLIIVGGTTLLVNPTRSLIANYNGPIVIINKGETTADSRACLIFSDTIGKVLVDTIQLIKD